MKLNYENLQEMKAPPLYLCNPNQKELCVITPETANVTLRLNDISELIITVNKYTTGNNGTGRVEQPCYSLLESRRLIKVEDIGWFEINSVSESDGENGTIKTITAQSHQRTFRDKGFYVYDSVYKFYNSEDPYDTLFDANSLESIPSVCGQLYKQLGIKIAISDEENFPKEDYGEWTIIYIDKDLRFKEDGSGNLVNMYRTLQSETTTGYDFMVNTVEQAFEVVWLFDFLTHTIKAKYISSITQPTNIYLSYDNLVQNIETTENADNIVTVLNCNGGNGLDISPVNPMGTNYIVNFDYYKNTNWMSQQLIDVLDQWKVEYDKKTDDFSALVKVLQDNYIEMSEYDEDIQYEELKIKALSDGRDIYIQKTADPQNNTSEVPDPLLEAETVEIEEKSLYEESRWYSAPLLKNDKKDDTIDETIKFTGFETSDMAGTSMNGTLQALASDGYLYFSDGDTSGQYCKINIASKLDSNKKKVIYVSGFTRYIPLNKASEWIEIHEKYLAELTKLKDSCQSKIDEILGQMKEISDVCGIQKFVINNDKTNDKSLYKEFQAYWSEGDYTNDAYAMTDSMTIADSIDLSKQLKGVGEAQLKNVSQPKFSFSITALDFLRLKEFQTFAEQLELGKTVSVEKNNGVIYSAAITEMTFNLLNGEDFSLTMSNSAKLNSNEFTFADLIVESSSVSKSVSSNWQDLLSYAKEKEKISSLIANPLDRALRAGMGGAINQEFVIDDTGILGRKYTDDSHASFSSEQVRMINNLILFTDDNWNSTKTALGKIYYTDKGEEKSAYGLVAQTIIGDLIMSNTLKIKNSENDSDSTILLNKDGITIKKIEKDKEGNSVETTFFQADTSGNVSITGQINATSGYIGDEKNGFLINKDSISHSLSDETKRVLISTGSSASYNISGSGDTAGWMLIAGEKFGVTSEGKLYAFAGYIGGLGLTRTLEKDKNSSWYTNKLFSDGFSLKTITPTGGETKSDYSMLAFWETDSKSSTDERSPSARIDASGVFAQGGFFEKMETTFLTSTGGVNAPQISSGALEIKNNKISYKPEGSVLTGFYFNGYTYEEKLTDDTKTYYSAVLTLHSGGGALVGANLRITLYDSSGEEIAAPTEMSFTVYWKAIWGDASENTITISKGETYGTFITPILGIGIEYYSLAYDSTRARTILGSWGTAESKGNYIGCIGHLLPDKTTYSLGSPMSYWGSAYIENLHAHTIYTGVNWLDSDARLKNSIAPTKEQALDKLFDSLIPSSYQFNRDAEKSRRSIHYGFIAQDIKAALEYAGLKSEDYAMITTKEDGMYALAYTEFIALNTNEIQKLKKRVTELEQKLEQYTNKEGE